jgi:hypothetical protein
MAEAEASLEVTPREKTRAAASPGQYYSFLKVVRQ